MIRVARQADADLFADLFEEFVRQIGNDTPIDRARLARRIQRWPLSQAVDDHVGVVTELKADIRTRRAEFTLALPRGLDKGRIGPVFAENARLCVAQLRRQEGITDISAWKAWGTFLHGQDENRVPDGGRSICESWREYFALDGKTVAVRPRTKTSSLFLAEMPLVELVAHVV